MTSSTASLTTCVLLSLGGPRPAPAITPIQMTTSASRPVRMRSQYLAEMDMNGRLNSRNAIHPPSRTRSTIIKASQPVVLATMMTTRKRRAINAAIQVHCPSTKGALMNVPAPRSVPPSRALGSGGGMPASPALSRRLLFLDFLDFLACDLRHASIAAEGSSGRRMVRHSAIGVPNIAMSSASTPSCVAPLLLHKLGSRLGLHAGSSEHEKVSMAFCSNGAPIMIRYHAPPPMMRSPVSVGLKGRDSPRESTPMRSIGATSTARRAESVLLTLWATARSAMKRTTPSNGCSHSSV
mmetsp:Transcript_4168/g.15388  ORF Transcript_4168/g.15388 Transcript_4168/m.15388 type:complete len:295 (-) Transcript_4168:2209-3093(-)